MRSHPPSQLALFDAPAPARPERPRPAPSKAAAPSESAPPVPATPHASPAVQDRLPLRDEALPLAANLARRLSTALGAPVHLRLTDNRATLVSFRRGPEGLRLRAHHLFLGAPDAVVLAMARYAGRNDDAAREALETYARSRRSLVRRERRPGKPLRARGRCFDLGALSARLNALYFDGRVRVDVGWARKPGRARRRSIHLGGYDVRLREIRIHPALDRPHVPAFVVDYLVFHAMLHADLEDPAEAPLDAAGRCAPEHTPAFSEREAAFPLRVAAQRWLAENLTSLMRG